ncbi:unnamed protein product [Dracunculus medinensis]|uniref:F5/8 type C domain-containing protein n=1 Tax=Dracunculus medinensis TaxID=318479 RepID=A0A0N4U4B9_DRAME|nr:unnamed protein product [Dracunculus medinensis]
MLRFHHSKQWLWHSPNFFPTGAFTDVRLGMEIFEQSEKFPEFHIGSHYDFLGRSRYDGCISDDWHAWHVYGMNFVFHTEMALEDVFYSLVKF